MSPLDINSQPKALPTLLSDTNPIYHRAERRYQWPLNIPYTYQYVVLLSRAPKTVFISFIFVKALNSPPLLHVFTNLNGYKTHKPPADAAVQQRVPLQSFTEHRVPSR